ncbi:hypothetical protein JAAARDRAFT_41259 [Jaapia argillacea MUCL 33604]|uniref:Uncharacterized protein n=1 Tax=Jaapia argillacea MUCL 33604 TaxID=933084 RepID=A0A067PL57_9AGAM|nr:hypothetical protein JAAARDRAFT_41259 [Jaapia argillacea MUCL 33604]
MSSADYYASVYGEPMVAFHFFHASTGSLSFVPAFSSLPDSSPLGKVTIGQPQVIEEVEQQLQSPRGRARSLWRRVRMAFRGKTISSRS